jgi:hypothetical protein
MADSKSAIVPASEAHDLEELPPRETDAEERGRLAKALTSRAVDRALGDEASPEVKKAIASQIAPWAERLVTVLDDFIRIPGTNIKIGLDPILGLIPGVGDIVTGTSSIALLMLALKERIPTVAIGRMVLNIGIDTAVGAIPLVGDAFDVVYRSNRQNLDIIKKYKDDPKAEPTAADKALVGLGIGLVALSVILPLTVGAAIGAWLATLFGG